jgi:hypothetical protein
MEAAGFEVQALVRSRPASVVRVAEPRFEFIV